MCIKYSAYYQYMLKDGSCCYLAWFSALKAGGLGISILSLSRVLMLNCGITFQRANTIKPTHLNCEYMMNKI